MLRYSANDRTKARAPQGNMLRYARMEQIHQVGVQKRLFELVPQGNSAYVASSVMLLVHEEFEQINRETRDMYVCIPAFLLLHDVASFYCVSQRLCR
jgi:hypothetical protein